MATTYQPSQWLMPDNANTDKVGNYSFDFDGSADYIDCGTGLNGSLELGDSFTLSAWVKFSAGTSDREIISNWTPAVKGVQLRVEDTEKITFLIAESNVKYKIKYSSVLAVDTWHLVVVTYDGSNTIGGINIYINGALDNDSSVENGTMASMTSTTSLIIGGATYLTQYYAGKMSEISIFNYALTSGQITTLYGDATAGVGNPMGLTPVPVGYWKGDKAGLGDQWAVPNQVSQDYVFDFDGGNIDLGSVINLGTTWSISLWINTTQALNSNGCLLSAGSGGNFTMLLLRNSRLMFYRGAAGDYNYSNTGLTFNDGNWHNIILTRNGTDTVSFYIDNVDETSTTAGTNNYDTEINFIGDDGGTWGTAVPFDGQISNIATWTSIVNTTTVYNNGTPGDLTSLSPISWWKLDDSATFSTNWSIPDDGSASNTGTSSGMTQGNLVPDTVTRGTAMYSEYSFSFDGVDDWFQMGNVLDQTLADSFSISAWINLAVVNSTYKLIVSKMDNSSPFNGYQISLDASEKLMFHLFGFAGGSVDLSVTSTEILAVDTWYHVVGTYDGSSVNTGLNLYIDGVAATMTHAGTATAGTISNAIDFQINGRDGNAFLFTGEISNVAFWESELSAANVLTIFNNGRPADLTDLSPVAWWKLGEEAFSTDPAADPNGWTVPDQIGSDDGTSSGNPDLVGEAPQSFANGLSVSMDIDDRIGESGFSDNNALSYNMDSDARVEDVPA